MAIVTYVEHDSVVHKVEVAVGESLMRGALDNMIDGIMGECRGGLACATCHCFIDAAWLDRLDPPTQAEREMLESAASEVRANSRLSCQISMRDALDGITVRLPERQF